MNAQISSAPDLDPNLKFKILDFANKGTRVKLYIIKSGGVFMGFGGSKRPHRIFGNTALIISTLTQFGRYDTEYDVDNAAVWDQTRRALATRGTKVSEF